MLHRKQAIHEEINQDPSELAIVGKGAAMVEKRMGQAYMMKIRVSIRSREGDERRETNPKTGFAGPGISATPGPTGGTPCNQKTQGREQCVVLVTLRADSSPLAVTVFAGIR